MADMCLKFLFISMIKRLKIYPRPFLSVHKVRRKLNEKYLLGIFLHLQLGLSSRCLAHACTLTRRHDVQFPGNTAGHLVQTQISIHHRKSSNQTTVRTARPVACPHCRGNAGGCGGDRAGAERGRREDKIESEKSAGRLQLRARTCLDKIQQN